MKLIVTFALCLSALAASAVELSEATNRQLIQELSRRLNSGGGEGGSAILTYLCDGSGYLKIESLNSSGASKSESIYLSERAKCEAQAALLRANKNKAYGLMLFALCDGSGYLHKYSANETGEIKKLSSTYLSSYEACLPQAKGINAP